MKIFRNKTKRWLTSISVICLLSLTLTSCLKDNNNTVATPVAYLSVFQASPDAPSTNFFLDNSQVNTTSFDYGSTIGYVTAYAGKRAATLKNIGGTTVATTDLNLDANTASSLFVANAIAHPDYIVLKDTLSMPSAGNAGIRFVNASADAPAVDFAVTGGSLITANKAYKGFSSFSEIPGGKTYSFEIRKAGTSTVLATITNAQINSAYVYTIWLHGSANSTTAATKLTLDIFNNAH